MTQADRDRLVALKKADKKLITQKQAAEELGITQRQVGRLLRRLKNGGDGAVVHGLRGRRSKRRIGDEIRVRAVEILSQAVYRGFGPTLASEYLASQHSIKVSRETLRKWMIGAKLWRAHGQKVEEIHQWRQRRSRYGELVQWDPSDHDWLEGRGQRIRLIMMIDDATSRRFGRFVTGDSTFENMDVLERYTRKYGRAVAYYTDKASHFKTTEKIKRGGQREGKDGRQMPPTQIERALKELDIAWIAANSPQAKGRVERSFGVAQDRLVKGMRVAGVSDLEQANRYLEDVFLPWCDENLTVAPANADDAHRSLEKHHDLAAILSYVDTRVVQNDYTLEFEAKRYQIASQDVRPGLRGAAVRVEKRRDGTIAVRFRDRYLTITVCETRPKVVKAAPGVKPRKVGRPRKDSDWNKNFDLQKAPKLWQAAQASGARCGESPE